jgi:hypothetical protein
MKLIASILAAASVAGGLSAQNQIDVSLSGGWTATPCCLQQINNFSSNNGAGVFLQGGASAEVGTTLCTNDTIARASIQGLHQGTGSHSDGRQAVVGCSEFYTRPTPGSVYCVLNAQPISPSANLQGTGYSGSALGTVIVTCPLFGNQTASAVADAVPPPAFPTMQTVPVSATGTASNVTSFQVDMDAGSRCWGQLTDLGSGIQLFAGADASGTVTLF